MIRVLDRYVIKELMIPFLIGTVGLVLVFQANLMIKLFKDYAAVNIPTKALLQLVWYQTPEFLNMTLPMAMALATALAMSRLHRESEITAMRAAGSPIRRAIVPLVVFGMLAGVLNFYVGDRLVPEGKKNFKRVAVEASVLGGAPDVANNVMLKLGARGSVYFGSVARTGTLRAKFRDVLYVEEMGNGVLAMTTAAEGEFEKGIWSMPNAITRRFIGERMESYKVGEYRINEEIKIEDVFWSAEDSEKPLSEMRQTVERGKKIGANVRMLEVAIQSRYAIPAACFVFALTGPIMAIAFGRGGAFAGVFISIVLVMLYFNLYVISTEIFGRNGWFPPVLAAWFPDLFMFLLGAAWLRRLE